MIKSHEYSEKDVDMTVEVEVPGKKDPQNIAQSQWKLIWRRFKKHKLAKNSLIILVLLYIGLVGFAEFFAVHDRTDIFRNRYLPPQTIRFFDNEGNFHIRPFIYNRTQQMDPRTWSQTTVEDYSQRYHLRLFARGFEYQLLGLFTTDIHLLGVEEGGQLFLLGTDQLGRCIFSRIMFGTRISLVIGLTGVFISMILGVVIGGISGLVGGIVDDAIQRLIEVLMSIPHIPLWMAFAAIVPDAWSPLQVYFAITLILSIIGWTGLARVVRSKFLSLREMDYVTAAHSFNAPMFYIIYKHLIPNFMSFLLVNLTLAIPTMILAETALSFLGIGLRPPVVSLGVLLQGAQNFQTVSMHPWLLFPVVMVIVIVLCYNFVGDGLRDAADPYQ